ncbi:MAG: metallophosphoesterase [Blastocatellia bacterium]
MRTPLLPRLRERRAGRLWRQPRDSRTQSFLRRKLAGFLQRASLEPYQLEITRQPVRIRKLPSAFHGFRIVQLSDIHHSSFLDESRIATAVERANELEPDLIVLTGDYVSHKTEYIAGCARALGRLQAPHGVFAVLGNHDHWTDGDMVGEAIAAAGIQLLNNQHVRLKRRQDTLCLAGIDDLMVKRDDLAAALEGTTRAETRVLLSHNPAIIREAARAGIDLVLSGHTHGGQINWELLAGDRNPSITRWLKRPSRRFIRGHVTLGSTHLYVNRGLGTVVVPLRYGCTPEITVLELLKS